MSDTETRHDKPADGDDNPSVDNPFATGPEQEGEKPKLNLSPKRAAVLGVMFGGVMVGLLLVCFLLSLALASCTG